MTTLLNSALLCGQVDGAAALSHESRGVSYYIVPLITRRLSGTGDRLRILLPEALLPQVPLPGERAQVRGELRSYRGHQASEPKLRLHVYARELLPPEPEDRNQIELNGVLCRPPQWRRTPMGREISDLMLSVPRRCGRSDFIPCIAWGAAAAQAAQWEKDRPVSLTGRFQSRSYRKVLGDRNEERIAYEVSVTAFQTLPEESEEQPLFFL